MASSADVPTEWVGVSSRGLTYEIVCSVFLSLALIAVVLRVTARMMSLGKLLIDDYLCILAAFFAIGLLVVAIYFPERGAMGWHLAQIPPAQIVVFFQVFYAAELLYTTTTFLYKLAVIFLYRQVFGESKVFNILSWTMVGITVAWYIAGMFATIFQCIPVEKAWNVTLPGTCLDLEAYVLGFSIANIIIDIIILMMPLPWIWRLNLSGKKKLAITGMFLLGAVVCIASIIRLTTLLPFTLVDATYRFFEVSLWSNIESSVGITAACLPTLRQFFFRYMAKRSNKGYSYPSPYGSSRGKSQLESASRSAADNDVPLAPMRPDEAFTETEIKSSMSNSRIEPYDAESGEIKDASFLDIDPSTTLTGQSQDDKSIIVRKETSVEVYE